MQERRERARQKALETTQNMALNLNLTMALVRVGEVRE